MTDPILVGSVGTSKITSQNACQVAATAVGKVFMPNIASNAAWAPGGCIIHDANAQVYYNHVNGADHIDVAPLCRKQVPSAEALYPNLSSAKTACKSSANCTGGKMEGQVQGIMNMAEAFSTESQSQWP
jgi:hypothetical protein